MNIVFMGTPDFAVPSLRMLIEHGYNVMAVVTQPDRPKGRKRELTPPPVKEEAIKHGIPVLQPERLRRSDTVDELRKLQPDLIVTAAYGQILPKAVLELPALGCINVHASLLPKYRGGAPIHYAVMNGDPVTGVTIMYMAEGLDTGDMLSKVEVPITDGDTTGSMFVKLSLAGAELLKETLPKLARGELQAVSQSEEQATYAPNIQRENERISWDRSALQLFNHIRGLNPFPGAFTTWNGEVLKVWASRKGENGTAAIAGNPAPGTVLRVSPEGIDVATGSGILSLIEIQPAGKKAMSVEQFVRGSSMTVGTVLGEPSNE
jgi:methionyl-tRNA formyltransferase